MPEYTETVNVTKSDESIAFSARTEDGGIRWRTFVGGITQYSKDGNKYFFGQGPIYGVDQDGEPIRVLLEMNADMPVGIVLNNSKGACISMTNEKGRIVFRDERKSRDHVIGTIGEEDPNYES